jgi:hypothetical protein
MKLKDLLFEGKKPKTLGSNKKMMEVIENLRSNPGSAVLEKIQSTLAEAGVQLDIDPIYEKIKAKYKKLDMEVANMLEQAIQEADSAMMQEKSKQLELIKKHATDIQDSLKIETKKPKKKK